MGWMRLATLQKRNVKPYVIVLAGVFLLSICPASRAQDAGESNVAVMPFVKGKDPEKIEETLNCPYASICFEDENILAGADQTLTRMLQWNMFMKP